MGLRRASGGHTAALAVVVGTAVAAISIPISVSAYPPPPGSGVVKVACSSAQPGSSCPVAFQFVNANGQPESNVLATFTVSGPGTVTPPSKLTDSSGQVQVVYNAPSTALYVAPSGPVQALYTVSSAPVEAVYTAPLGQTQAVTAGATTGCPTATITGSTSDAQVQTTVAIGCAKAAGSLPPGSTAAPSNGPPKWSLAMGGVGIAGLLAAAGLVTASRRRSLRRAG